MQVILDCSTLEQMAHALPLVKSCDVMRGGALRMSTPFLYPNGDRIDVFLESKSNHLFRDFSLSDFGQTSLYLRSAQVKLDFPAKKKELLDSILAQFGVHLHGGDLIVEIPESESSDISDAIFRLSQACLRFSDFASHQRLRGENPFKSDVEGFLHASGLTYISDAKPVGRFKNSVAVDFEVFGRERKSYICVLASLTPSAAHTSATETFRKWYDIADSEKDSHELITVYNSTSISHKRADLDRLRNFSKIFAYPSEQDLLKAALAA